MYRLDCTDTGAGKHDHTKELLKVDAAGNLTDETQKMCWALVAHAQSDAQGKVEFNDLPVEMCIRDRFNGSRRLEKAIIRRLLKKTVIWPI